MASWLLLTCGGLLAGYLLYLLLESLTARKHCVRPRAALAAQVLNTLAWPAWKLGLGPFKHKLDYDYVKEWSMRKARASDFGGLEFEKNFRLVLGALQQERITPLGHLGIWDQFSSRLTSRLRMEALLATKPAIKAVEVRQPLFVIGMPRSGTTLLHRLLSLDPLARYPKTWELLHPSPIDVKADFSNQEVLRKDAERRLRKVRKAIKAIKLVAPGLDAVHETGAELPEECLFAISMEFPLMPFAFYTLHRPELFPHVLKERTPKMYSRYKDVLRILTWQAPEYPANAGLRWTLKAPNHLLYIKQLTEVFQDARIVWTHRSAVNSIPSWCSLVRILTDACLGERIDLGMIGKVSFDNFAMVLQRAIDELEEAEKKYDVKAQHVLYQDLVDDPIGLIRKLYAQFGFDFTPQFHDRLQAYLEQNRKEREAMQGSKATLHQYHPEEFGLSKAQLLTKFEDYHQQFGIPH